MHHDECLDKHPCEEYGERLVRLEVLQNGTREIVKEVKQMVIAMNEKLDRRREDFPSPSPVEIPWVKVTAIASLMAGLVAGGGGTALSQIIKILAQ